MGAGKRSQGVNGSREEESGGDAGLEIEVDTLAISGQIIAMSMQD